MAAQDDYDNSHFACDVLADDLKEWLFDHEPDNMKREINAQDLHTVHELHIRLAGLVEWLLEETA